MIGCFDWLFISFTVAQQRLKNWELRERKKARDYSKEIEREEERRREMVKQLCSQCILGLLLLIVDKKRLSQSN